MHSQHLDGLSYCDINGKMLFLDLDLDLYFRLDPSAEHSFKRLLSGETPDPSLLSHPAGKKLLAMASASQTGARTATNLPAPAFSALEQALPDSNARPGITVQIEVMHVVWSTWRKLRARTLRSVLEEATAYRRSKTTTPLHQPADLHVDTPEKASRKFTRARRYVPIEPRCLLDSLALLRFLSRRGLPANIVFGVMPEPFSAHCWVQAGDVVLNETLSNALAHTPIRTV